jgi:hypothetical protein
LGKGGAKFPGDFNGTVGTGRIYDNHLLRKVAQGAQAGPKIGLFITSYKYHG